MTSTLGDVQTSDALAWTWTVAALVRLCPVRMTARMFLAAPRLNFSHSDTQPVDRQGFDFHMDWTFTAGREATSEDAEITAPSA